jgi:hypothetical protein
MKKRILSRDDAPAGDRPKGLFYSEIRGINASMAANVFSVAP